MGRCSSSLDVTEDAELELDERELNGVDMVYRDENVGCSTSTSFGVQMGCGEGKNCLLPLTCERPASAPANRCPLGPWTYACVGVMGAVGLEESEVGVVTADGGGEGPET